MYTNEDNKTNLASHPHPHLSPRKLKESTTIPNYAKNLKIALETRKLRTSNFEP